MAKLSSKSKKTKETYIPPPRPIIFKNREQNKFKQNQKAGKSKNTFGDLRGGTLPLPNQSTEPRESSEYLDPPSEANDPSLIPQNSLSSQDFPCTVVTSHSLPSVQLLHTRPNTLGNILDEHMDMILVAASRKFLIKAVQVAADADYALGLRARQRDLSIDKSINNISNSSSNLLKNSNQRHMRKSAAADLDRQSSHPTEDLAGGTTDTPSNQILDEQDAYQGPENGVTTPNPPIEDDLLFVSPIRCFQDFEEEFEKSYSASEASLSSSTADIFKSTLTAIDERALLEPAYAECIRGNDTSQIKVLIPSLKNKEDYVEPLQSSSFPTPPRSQPSPEKTRTDLNASFDEQKLQRTESSYGIRSASSLSELEMVYSFSKKTTKRKRSPLQVESLLRVSPLNSHEALLRSTSNSEKALSSAASKSTENLPTTSKERLPVLNSQHKPVNDLSSSGDSDYDSDSSLASLKDIMPKSTNQPSEKKRPVTSALSSSEATTSPPHATPVTSLAMEILKNKSDHIQPSKKRRFSTIITRINGDELSPPVVRKSPTPFFPRASSVIPSSSANFLKKKSSLPRKPIKLVSDQEEDIGSGTEVYSDIEFQAFDDTSPTPIKELEPRDRHNSEVKTQGKDLNEVQDDKTREVEIEKERASSRTKVLTTNSNDQEQLDRVMNTNNSKVLNSPPTVNKINTVPTLLPHFQPLLNIPSSQTPQSNKNKCRRARPKTPKRVAPVQHSIQPTFPMASTSSSSSFSFPHHFSPHHIHSYSTKNQNTTPNIHNSPYTSRTPQNSSRNFTPINNYSSTIFDPKTSHRYSSASNTPRKPLHIRFNNDTKPIQPNTSIIHTERSKNGRGRTNVNNLKKREMKGLPSTNSPTPLKAFIKNEFKKEYYGGSRGEETKST